MDETSVTLLISKLIIFISVNSKQSWNKPFTILRFGVLNELKSMLFEVCLNFAFFLKRGNFYTNR